MLRHVLSFMALCAVVAVPRSADACSCMGPQAPCEATWRVDSVFVAQVVRVERTSTHVRAHLMSLETLHGPSGIVSVDTGTGGGDCGYGFQQGETYLIYARGDRSGRYSTGICDRTRRISEGC